MSADDLPGGPPSEPMGETLSALSDHLILEEAGAGENRTPSGLLIPANAAQPKQAYRRFRVVALGPHCSDDRLSEIPEPTVQSGDLVLAPHDELGVYREGGNTYFIARYEQIAAIIREG